jgi:hypothetical protein
LSTQRALESRVAYLDDHILLRVVDCKDDEIAADLRARIIVEGVVDRLRNCVTENESASGRSIKIAREIIQRIGGEIGADAT